MRWVPFARRAALTTMRPRTSTRHRGALAAVVPSPTTVAADARRRPQPLSPTLNAVAAAAAVGVPAARCAMVGDAMTDLVGARRAGFGAAILVGGDEVAAHAPHADFWIRDLAQLLPRGAGSL